MLLSVIGDDRRYLSGRLGGSMIVISSHEFLLSAKRKPLCSLIFIDRFVLRCADMTQSEFLCRLDLLGLAAALFISVDFSLDYHALLNHPLASEFSERVEGVGSGSHKKTPAALRKRAHALGMEQCSY